MWKSLNLGLAVVLGVYLLLAVAYSVVVPIGRGADEWAHYWYAQFIAENGRLPATIDERETAGYKADWPPLYHTFAAAVAAIIDTDGAPVFKYRADELRRQLVPAAGPEAILHTEDEQFPWRQEVLIWHLVRMLSILFSAVTVLVTGQIASESFQSFFGNDDGRLRQLSSRRPGLTTTLALVATTVLAFNPRFLFTGMLFNYDSLTLLLSSLFLWLCVRVVKGNGGRWAFWGLGGLAGLALITKYLTAFLPLIIVYVAWRAHTRRQPEILWFKSRFFWRTIGQAGLAYAVVVSWWFIYLVVTFNEVEQYGPILGMLAPLIRGDGSDRTVEAIFAWLSGNQADLPATIERQSYSGWQLLTGFWQTFWGNPVVRPYPLNWFIVIMVVISLTAIIGLIVFWRQHRQERVVHLLGLLVLLCLSPLPFVILRLFGARDALEALQGRHFLFLAGPALATLLVTGLNALIMPSVRAMSVSQESNQPQYGAGKSGEYLFLGVNVGLAALVLTGAVAQLVLMGQAYPPPLPVQTTPLVEEAITPDSGAAELPGGGKLLGLAWRQVGQTLAIDFWWKGGAVFAPEDYRVAVKLVGDGGAASGWYGYQTQARYPTRAWEENDIIRDTAYLPLQGIAAGDYQLQWRIDGEQEPLTGWQPLADYTLYQMVGLTDSDKEYTMWYHGLPAKAIPQLGERETVQITYRNPNFETGERALIGPDGQRYSPDLAGPGWANFIVRPHWPAGDYQLDGFSETVLRVLSGERQFDAPDDMATALPANFDNKIKLLGYTLPARYVSAGEGLPVTLFWQGLAWPAEDFVIFSRLLDNQQVAWGGYDRRAQENYSTLFWAPGEIITDGFAVPVSPDAPDGVYWLSVGWYLQVDGEAQSLPLINPETGEMTDASAVTFGPIKVGGPPAGALAAENDHPTAAVNSLLGEAIRLAGYTLQTTPDQLDLTLFWEAVQQPGADYTVFVHVRDATGRVIAQKDGPPTGGLYPTGLWGSGEVIRDNMQIPLTGVPPGTYEVVVGMYDFDTGVRLPVAGSEDDTIVLEQVRP
jgi:4-amino-4-deoxy-L-arabinose transferase-like glycosyltransferase